MKKFSIVLIVLTACKTIDEENYAEIAGEVTCSQLKTCEQGYFDSLWDTLPDCQADYDEYYDEREDQFLSMDCEFDLENAQACIEAMETASCETWYETQSSETATGFDDCSQVWECLYE